MYSDLQPQYQGSSDNQSIIWMICKSADNRSGSPTSMCSLELFPFCRVRASTVLLLFLFELLLQSSVAAGFFSPTRRACPTIAKWQIWLHTPTPVTHTRARHCIEDCRECTASTSVQRRDVQLDMASAFWFRPLRFSLKTRPDTESNKRQ